MWIIPKQLHALSGAPDTEAFLSDLNEQSQACAQSLLARSKPSPARTWLLKWKRDSWTQHLFGRILKPSHAKPFETAWTSLWPDILANPSAQPENDSEPKTLGTSGLTSSDQYLLFDLDSVSLKMSKDTFRWDSPQSSAIWKSWVTKCRGEYSARVKSAHLTSASGSSSWPTVTANEDSYRIGGESQQSKCLSAMARRGEMEENWSTPNCTDGKTGSTTTQGRSLVADIQLHGQAAPASSSSLGSRQGLWPTARSLDGSVNESLETWTARHHRKEAEGINLHRPLPIAVMQEQNKQLWPTITAHTPDMESNGPNGHSGTYLAGAVKAEEQKEWRTPTVAEEKNQNTSKQIYLQNQVGATQKQWATPIQGDSHLASTPEVAQKRIEEGKVTLSRQMAAQWGTPTARDHKSGRGNEEREYKELTPMVERAQSGKLNPRWVETLMGLPVGWVMPSCKSPVTIARTSSDFSATESCQQQQNELFEP